MKMVSQKMKNSRNKNDQNHAKNIYSLGNTRLSLIEMKISHFTLEKYFKLFVKFLGEAAVVVLVVLPTDRIATSLRMLLREICSHRKSSCFQLLGTDGYY